MHGIGEIGKLGRGVGESGVGQGIGELEVGLLGTFHESGRFGCGCGAGRVIAMEREESVKLAFCLRFSGRMNGFLRRWRC